MTGNSEPLFVPSDIGKIVSVEVDTDTVVAEISALTGRLASYVEGSTMGRRWTRFTFEHDPEAHQVPIGATRTRYDSL